MDLGEALQRDGYCHLRGFFGAGDLERIEADVFAVACGFAASLRDPAPAAFPPGEVDRPLVELVKRRPDVKAALYDRLQQLPSLLAVPGSAEALKLAASALGSERLGVWPRAQLRLDFPDDAVNLIRWHNDHLYNKGTTASLTFWFPLVDCSVEMGRLMFARGSHRLSLRPVRTGGPERFDHDLPADVAAGLDVVTPEVRRGDLVVFHSLLWHSGRLNRSPDRARVSGLFRLQDLNKLELEVQP